MKRFIALSMLIGLCLFQGGAFAVLTGVSVSLTWAIDASPVNSGPSTVTSSQIFITNASRGATLIGTIPRTLSRTITPGAAS
jgi:hypothetical protein